MSSRDPSSEGPWLAWARRLHALAKTGEHFGDSAFDRERYEEIRGIATAMLAELAARPVAEVRELLADDRRGYDTPQIDVRGALIEDDRILLVQEKADGCWTLPGGYADVGFSAAENVVKEIWEEANLRVRVTRCIALRHKARHPYRPDVRDFYKLFFLCERVAAGEPAGGLETLAAAFFAPDALPPLSTGRVIEADIALAFEMQRDPTAQPVID
ncbi:MAG: NUDIX hydrolase [Pseudomonadota bacterium]